MPARPKLTAAEAERVLLKAGFARAKSKGGHRIYRNGGVRIVLPFHRGKSLHPKTIKQVFAAVEAASAYPPERS